MRTLQTSLLQLSFLAVLVSLAFSIQYLSAWTGPQSAPPTCVAGQIGCDAPINVGSTLQSKNGGLGVQTLDVTSDANIVGQLGFNATNPTYTIDMDALAEAATNGIRFPDGTVQVSAGGGGSQTLSFDDYLHVQDQKPSGTSGGNMTFGSYNTRVLNTILTNTISGASLAGNTVTLPAGTYYVEIEAPGQSAGVHKAKLRNTTDAVDVLIGTNGYGDYGSGDSMSRSLITGVFTISAQKNFQVLHRGTTSDTSNHFGRATSFGDIEVYTDAKIWKVN